MNAETELDESRMGEEEAREVVAEYVRRISRLYAASDALSPAHLAFLNRVVSVFPTLSDAECLTLARALKTPRLVILARAVAEACPALLE